MNPEQPPAIEFRNVSIPDIRRVTARRVAMWSLAPVTSPAFRQEIPRGLGRRRQPNGSEVKTVSQTDSQVWFQRIFHPSESQHRAVAQNQVS